VVRCNSRVMPRFAANLAYLFTERPLLELFGAAAAAGFAAVELQFPYDHSASAVKAAIDRHFAYLERSGELRARRRQRLRERVIDVVVDRVRTRLWLDETTNAWIDAKLPELESGALTPFAAADALLARSGDLLTRGRT
jgi:hypothetical protein